MFWALEDVVSAVSFVASVALSADSFVLSVAFSAVSWVFSAVCWVWAVVSCLMASWSFFMASSLDASSDVFASSEPWMYCPVFSLTVPIWCCISAFLLLYQGKA